jgi:hypothetical protein
VVLEYARNVLGFADAAHAEYDPYASDLFITGLSCSLVGQTMTVMVRKNTTAARLYPSSAITEKYYCNFGLNLDHLPALTTAGLVVSGTDQDGEPRIVELTSLRYFLATLFVPQTSSMPEDPHADNRFSARRDTRFPIARPPARRLPGVDPLAGERHYWPRPTTDTTPTVTSVASLADSSDESAATYIDVFAKTSESVVLTQPATLSAVGLTSKVIAIQRA